jgi:class 3 adenylate cyclase
MIELPTGTVTLLFTDIEGSTRLLERLGDRYVQVLAVHQELLRAAFGQYHGHEVGTEGDGFFVAFAKASDAVAAAVAAQRALAAQPWPDGVALRIRMGIHTGAPIVVAQDYAGLDVHRAAASARLDMVAKPCSPNPPVSYLATTCRPGWGCVTSASTGSRT